jgi:hypothetical protein
MANASNTTAPTEFIQTKLEKYAYRRFGKGQGLPLLCLQHFTGTLDNWDPAVTDPLKSLIKAKPVLPVSLRRDVKINARLLTPE